MIILNEVDYVRQIIETKERPPKMAMKRLIVYLCKYYYNKTNFKDAKEFQRFILDLLLEFHFNEAEYEEYRFNNYVYTICKKLLSGELSGFLRDIKEIIITKSEAEIIRSCETDRQKKLLFTLYVLAKTYNNPTGWIGYSDNDIFSLANLQATAKEKVLLIKELIDLGLVQYNHVIDKNSYKVELDGNQEDIEITISTFTNIGHQWIVYEDNTKMICERCGRIVVRNSNNQRYCKKCGHDINIEKTMKNAFLTL